MTERNPNPPPSGTGLITLGGPAPAEYRSLSSIMADGDRVSVNGEPFTAHHENGAVVLRPSVPTDAAPDHFVHVGRIVLGEGPVIKRKSDDIRQRRKR